MLLGLQLFQGKFLPRLQYRQFVFEFFFLFILDVFGLFVNFEEAVELKN